MQKPIIAVFGASKVTSTAKSLRFALQTGELIIKSGYSLVCGGEDGVMEAVCKGASRAKERGLGDGQIIGIMSSTSKKRANKYIEIPILTGIGLARNYIIASTCDLAVAIGGGAGTLSEVAYAWQLHKKIIVAKLNDGAISESLIGKSLDKRRKDKIYFAANIKELEKKIKKLL